jgi:hypothetical protein
MQALSSSDFIDLWERGRRLHPLDQSLQALAAAFPETSQDSLADWPLGRRNTALALLHRSSFGPRLQGWLSCGRCGEKLEFEVDSQSMVNQGEMEATPAETVVLGEHTFRLPTSRDLASIARERDSRLAVIGLMQRCWLGTGEPPSWSDEDMEEVGERMAAKDPMAETRMTFECPVCGNK